jgi:hypothetical protein
MDYSSSVTGKIARLSTDEADYPRLAFGNEGIWPAGEVFASTTASLHSLDQLGILAPRAN